MRAVSGSVEELAAKLDEERRNRQRDVSLLREEVDEHKGAVVQAVAGAQAATSVCEKLEGLINVILHSQRETELRLKDVITSQDLQGRVDAFQQATNQLQGQLDLVRGQMELMRAATVEPTTYLSTTSCCWQNDVASLRADLASLHTKFDTDLSSLHTRFDTVQRAVSDANGEGVLQLHELMENLTAEVQALRPADSVASTPEAKVRTCRSVDTGLDAIDVVPIMDSGSLDEGGEYAERMVQLEAELEEERRQRQTEMIQMRTWLAQFLINTQQRLGDKVPPEFEVEASLQSIPGPYECQGRRPPPPSPCPSDRHLEEGPQLQTSSVHLKVVQPCVPALPSLPSPRVVDDRVSPRPSPRQVTSTTHSPRVMKAVHSWSVGSASAPPMVLASLRTVRGRSPSQSPPASPSPIQPVVSHPITPVPAVRSWSPVRRQHTPPLPLTELQRTSAPLRVTDVRTSDVPSAEHSKLSRQAPILRSRVVQQAVQR
mmetsp:Transcript_42107/g.94673  ORF Transcript_42107/g.94673 Transcript_42107/m.94673 type:complete len:487 (-) Transcript_42107:11-1471(-)